MGAMAFRDDREALLQRVEALEHALASERAGHVESEAARAELLTELTAARRELERLRPYAPDAPASSRPLVMLGVALAVGVAFMVVVLALGMTRTREVSAPRRDPLVVEPSGAGRSILPGLPAGATGCRSACDCTGGAECASGQCLLGTAPRYCCDDPRCPAGTSCDRPDGTASACGPAAVGP